MVSLTAAGNSAVAADIDSAMVDIAQDLQPDNACYLYLSRAANLIYLADDSSANWLGPVTLNYAGTLQNTQCILDPGSSSNIRSGTNLTLNLALTVQARLRWLKDSLDDRVRRHVQRRLGAARGMDGAESAAVLPHEGCKPLRRRNDLTGVCTTANGLPQGGPIIISTQVRVRRSDDVPALRRPAALLHEILDERVVSSRNRINPRGVNRKMSSYSLCFA